jgi:hypothetical protein
MFLNRRSAVFLLAISVSCASHQAPIDDTAPAAKPAPMKMNLISRDELQDPRYVGGDALSTISRLRPTFLRQRPQSSYQDSGAGKVLVSVDYGPLQGTNILASVPTVSLYEVHLLSPEDAMLHFGLNANGGPVVVLLTSKP